jgi:hypothetical protein
MKPIEQLKLKKTVAAFAGLALGACAQLPTTRLAPGERVILERGQHYSATMMWENVSVAGEDPGFSKPMSTGDVAVAAAAAIIFAPIFALMVPVGIAGAITSPFRSVPEDPARPTEDELKDAKHIATLFRRTVEEPIFAEQVQRELLQHMDRHLEARGFARSASSASGRDINRHAVVVNISAHYEGFRRSLQSHLRLCSYTVLRARSSKAHEERDYGDVSCSHEALELKRGSAEDTPLIRGLILSLLPGVAFETVQKITGISAPGPTARSTEQRIRPGLLMMETAKDQWAIRADEVCGKGNYESFDDTRSPRTISDESPKK